MADDAKRLQELDAEMEALDEERDKVQGRIDDEADLAKREGREVDREKQEALERELKENGAEYSRVQEEYDRIDRELGYRHGRRRRGRRP